MFVSQRTVFTVRRETETLTTGAFEVKGQTIDIAHSLMALTLIQSLGHGHHRARRLLSIRQQRIFRQLELVLPEEQSAQLSLSQA